MKIQNLQFVVPEYERSYDNYESEILEFVNYLPKNRSIVELGGSIGVVSCFLNNKLRPNIHVVVEANPNLIPIIKENGRLNNCNFEVINKIFSYKEKPSFNIDRSFVTSSEKRSGSPTIVETIIGSPITLKELAKNGSILVCDIEGNEIDLIDNEMKTLRESISYLVVEFHQRITGKYSILKAKFKLWLNGFKQINQIGESYIFFNKKHGLHT